MPSGHDRPPDRGKLTPRDWRCLMLTLVIALASLAVAVLFAIKAVVLLRLLFHV
jgi:hypothetical protein